MILNYKDAIELLVGCVDDIGFNTYIILNVHALLSNNLLAALQPLVDYASLPLELNGPHFTPSNWRNLSKNALGSPWR